MYRGIDAEMYRGIVSVCHGIVSYLPPHRLRADVSVETAASSLRDVDIYRCIVSADIYRGMVSAETYYGIVSVEMYPQRHTAALSSRRCSAASSPRRCPAASYGIA